MARILCLDDEPSAVMILEDHLQRAGHQTVGVRGTTVDIVAHASKESVGKYVLSSNT